jgi:hypothetical protein
MSPQEPPMTASTVLSPFVKKSSVLAALLLGASSLLGGAALADTTSQTSQTPVGTVAASAKLPVQKPTVAVRSWNGRRITVVTPSPVNPRFPARGLDPMNIQVSDVHPDSELELLRQKQSQAADVDQCGACVDLKAAATKAAQYVPMFKWKTTQASSAQAHNELVTDPSKVAWPNSRILIKGTTRDGQTIPHVAAIVEGVRDQRIMPYDAATNTVVNEMISGRFLPSARAWIKTHNLFVSEPMQNQAQLADGKKLIKLADDKLAAAQKKQAEITAEQGNAQQQKPVDYTKIRTLQIEIQKLQQEAYNDRQQGDQLVAEGSKIKVQVVSVAALPASTPAHTVNVRVRGENKPGATHTAHTVSDEYDGYTVHSVEALALDHLETTVAFTPHSGSALGSTATVKFQVPDHKEKATFTMGGIKYFRIKPTSVTANHDPVPQS